MWGEAWAGATATRSPARSQICRWHPVGVHRAPLVSSLPKDRRAHPVPRSVPPAHLGLRRAHGHSLDLLQVAPRPPAQQVPPMPIHSPSAKHLPGGSSASGSSWNEEKVLVWGLVAPLSWVSVPISSTADVCPWLGRAQGGSLQSPEMVPSRGHGHLTPLHPSVSRGAKSPASGTFLLSWDQPHPHQQEPSRGFQGAWGQPPEPAGTAGTLWARHKQCRIHAVTPGHAQRTGCLAKGAAAAGVGAGRSCSAPRCPHFPAPQCPDRCLARQGTPARWGRGPVVVGRAPCSPWVPSSVEVSAKQAQRWLGSVRFSCRGLINS